VPPAYGGWDIDAVAIEDRGHLMPRCGTIEANGIEFAFLTAGSGPLALCLHGFPDSAHTWRHLLPALAGAGYRAVAPFMRGYAPTGLARDGDYGLARLVEDAVELHQALGGDERAVLIGHDWGAEAAYGAASLAPDRWRRVVTIAVPPLALDEQIFSDYDQLKRLFYIFFFRTPDAGAVVAADDMAFLDRLWRDWSPGYDATEDLEYAKRCLREPGNLGAALEYYRDDEAGRERAGGGDRSAAERALFSSPRLPVLYLHGDRDGCVDIALAAGATAHLGPDSRMDVIRNAGHFLHLEHRVAVNERILDWIES
jgi:pimeloyl-ACP methyl ester carboxylesterase